MAIDYRNTAVQLVEALGGKDNISTVSHCATRLRFILHDESLVQNARISSIPGVITTVKAGGQFQVVIGNHVRDAY
ncbi:MAG: PTS glucose/sucrose transporter subunit IIB [Ruminococcus sp.]|nr:PTS glucose/sucrose transporter subunit IIB [Ruminococcus sp.]